MFNTILIANRGEIACRVAHTARRLGLRTVAVYSDADAHARHVQMCDEAVHLGGAAPADSYLRADRIIQAALDHGAEAVHPGYGFLSENAAFAQACADAGLVFVGPPPAAMAAMGSKSAAKALMARAGVPLVPGYHGDDNRPPWLLERACEIGFPVLIKASAGGGGRGMRRVDRQEDFVDALAACQREARSCFGDDQVLIERYVSRPRHIEIQVFADTHGHYLHLFERDCSVQRRHQKVLEEAPAPGLSVERRAEMGAAAVAAARAVNYVGAGTVEFIAEPTADGDLRFYFMEMNTRLQVEHPVTEAITGLDLVEWQLRVAAGQPLPVRQDELRIHGHAIEARICAEHPDAGFLPASGRLTALRWPPHRAFACTSGGMDEVRVDAGVLEGDLVRPHYDSMLAKLIVWGRDRQQALARMEDALARTHVLGPATNVTFLRHVVRSRAFAQADLDTALIEREGPALFHQPGLSWRFAVAGIVARQLAVECAHQVGEAAPGPRCPDPWGARDSWRLHGLGRRHFDLLPAVGSAGQPARPLSAALERERDGSLGLRLGEDGWRFRARPLGNDHYQIDLDDHRMSLAVYVDGARCAVFGPDSSCELTLLDPLTPAGPAARVDAELSAPLPGRLVALLVRQGDRVQAGQSLATIEAMKMEHTLHAPRDGEVRDLPYAVGDPVAEGALIVRLA